MKDQNKQNVKREYFQFTREQRIQIVKEIENGELTRKEALKKYNIAVNLTLTRWLQEFGTGAVQSPKNFPQAEQRKVAYRVLTGEVSQEQVVRELRVSAGRVAHWVNKFKKEIKQEDQIKKLDRAPKGKTVEEKELKELKLKVAALEMMIDIAEREFKIEIRKKSGTKQ